MLGVLVKDKRVNASSWRFGLDASESGSSMRLYPEILEDSDENSEKE